MGWPFHAHALYVRLKLEVVAVKGRTTFAASAVRNWDVSPCIPAVAGCGRLSFPCPRVKIMSLGDSASVCAAACTMRIAAICVGREPRRTLASWKYRTSEGQRCTRSRLLGTNVFQHGSGASENVSRFARIAFDCVSPLTGGATVPRTVVF